MSIDIPEGLCATHRQQAVEWRNNDYDWRNPGEWPGGLSCRGRQHIMDSRTTHEERAREFERKNREQIELIARICRSGVSCDPAATEEVGA